MLCLKGDTMRIYAQICLHMYKKTLEVHKTTRQNREEELIAFFFTFATMLSFIWKFKKQIELISRYPPSKYLRERILRMQHFPWQKHIVHPVSHTLQLPNTLVSWAGSGNWIFKLYLQTLLWLENTCPVSAFNLPRAVIEVTWNTSSINSATSQRPSHPSGFLPFAPTLVLWLGQASWLSFLVETSFH